MEIHVVRYTENHFEQWDDFVLNRSCNGTFLQSRLFLNYHKEGKYEDCSLLFYSSNQIVAVCPACVQYENEKKVFASHSGSTYGGIVVCKSILRINCIMQLLDEYERWLIENGFSKCTLKQQNPLMSQENMDILEFVFFFRKYNEFKELDIYVDLDALDEDSIIASFSKLKRRLTKKCIQHNMDILKLSGPDDMDRFVKILSDNLKKYGLQPYHSANDLIDLQNRFPREIEYWGCRFEEKIVAVSMVFIFDKCSCVHTHYLAADPDYNKQSPMTFIYYKMIEIYKERGFKSISWGITSEHKGTEINYNLTNTKEEFGGRHNVVSVYEKDF